MEKEHLNYYKVENFKSFESLEIKDIGQFNLIVGDNNVGKTSLLESLVVDENLPDFLSNIVCTFSWRDIRKLDAKNEFNYFDLIFNDKKKNSIVYTFKKGSNKKSTYQFIIDNIADLTQKEINFLKGRNLSKTKSKFTAKFLLNGELKDIIYIHDYQQYSSSTYIPYIPVKNEDPDDVIDFFSSNFQNSKSKRSELIKNLKFFIPDVADIEISSGIIPSTNNLVLWREKFDSPFLLKTFGSGTVRALRMFLELAQCENNRIMIDEIDTGIHYTRIKRLWSTLLEFANQYNVQIFATTHSEECLKYYKEALHESNHKSSARIIKLVETKTSKIEAFTYTFEQFEQALDFGNEIR